MFNTYKQKQSPPAFILPIAGVLTIETYSGQEISTTKTLKFKDFDSWFGSHVYTIGFIIVIYMYIVSCCDVIGAKILRLQILRSFGIWGGPLRSLQMEGYNPCTRPYKWVIGNWG